jgi:hypothetical protein
MTFPTPHIGHSSTLITEKVSVRWIIFDPLHIQKSVNCQIIDNVVADVNTALFKGIVNERHWTARNWNKKMQIPISKIMSLTRTMMKFLKY